MANREKQAVARYPFHTLQNIVTFSCSGASPALMGACAERQVGFAFCAPRGKFLARVCGEGNGNVLLRRTQYRTADDPALCCQISRTMEGSTVLLTDNGRKTFLKSWQEKKKETLTHPYLGEKLPWGMIPYIQALLLAQYLRGDLDAYPPFLWK